MPRKELPLKSRGGGIKGKSVNSRLGERTKSDGSLTPNVAVPLASAPRKPSRSWKLEDAKAKFSEVVRRAHDEGPQYVTVRGKRAVAIIDAEELQRLLPIEEKQMPFLQFMESLYVPGLNLERDADFGRDVDL